MACTALVIGVAHPVLIEHLPEFGVILVEEVVLADAYPVQARALLELLDEFRLQVVLDFAFALVHTSDSCREESDVGEVRRLVGTDVQ